MSGPRELSVTDGAEAESRGAGLLSRGAWRDAVLILALGLFVTCYRVGVPPLAGTEGHRALPADGMVRTGDWLLPRLYGRVYLTKPPMVYWLIGGVEKLTGVADETSWRMPSAMAGGLLGMALCLVGNGGGAMPCGFDRAGRGVSIGGYRCAGYRGVGDDGAGNDRTLVGTEPAAMEVDDLYGVGVWGGVAVERAGRIAGGFGRGVGRGDIQCGMDRGGAIAVVEAAAVGGIFSGDRTADRGVHPRAGAWTVHVRRVRDDGV